MARYYSVEPQEGRPFGYYTGFGDAIRRARYEAKKFATEVDVFECIGHSKLIVAEVNSHGNFMLRSV